MKAKLLYSTVFFLCFFLTQLHAQGGFVSSGGNTSDNGKSLSYSIGQLDYVNMTQSDVMLTNHGLQQPLEIDATSSTSFIFPDMDVLFFPNPTSSVLNIKLDKLSASELEYALLDLLGKVYFKGKLLTGLNTISTIDLFPGTYFIQLISPSKEIKTFKLIKQ